MSVSVPSSEKRFWPGYRACKNRSEQLRRVEIGQGGYFLRLRKIGLIMRYLYLFLQPIPDFGVLNVHVFDAESATIGLTQGIEQFVQGGSWQSVEMTGVECAIEVGIAQANLSYRQGPRMLRRRLVKRIEIRHSVSEASISVDQANDPRLIRRRDNTRARFSEFIAFRRRFASLDPLNLNCRATSHTAI